jgi:hypothetical protein
MRKTRKQNGGNMAEAQRRVDEWVAAGDVNAPLHLSNLELTKLPTLPDNLLELNCNNNKLTSLPTLPDNLQILKCEYSKLRSLPKLPNSLVFLYCTDNKLTSLPILPNTLEYLYCMKNNLTSIPILPNKLNTLACAYNKLTNLPMLPNSLEFFYCQFNNLPEVYYTLDNEPTDVYINRIRKLQKSRKNVLNSLKPHITKKKRNVFANTTYKNMPRNVVKKIANYMDEEDLENININSLKPKNVKRNETRKLKKV